MPWLNTHDGEHAEPWVFQAGNEAYGVYVRLAGYCAQHLTDGIVPMPMALMIAGGKKPLLTLEQVGRLEVRGMREKPHSVFLPFYLDANRARSVIEAERESKSAKGKKAASARWAQRRASNGVHP